MDIKAVSTGPDKVIALAGNPNVGKSTVFNALTGLNQHTGNWPGKTVANAQGRCCYKGQGLSLIDLPGCYSLMAHSAEEEVARDFVLFGRPDALVVVCDASCLERNLNLVLQALEITPHVVVCVNLMDEARKKKIEVNIAQLSELLGVPVVGTTARSRQGLDALLEAMISPIKPETAAYQVTYPKYIEAALKTLKPLVELMAGEALPARWLSLKLLEGDEALLRWVDDHLQTQLAQEIHILNELRRIRDAWEDEGIDALRVKDDMVRALITAAESIAGKTVVYQSQTYDHRDRALDKLLTSKWTGFPMMLLLLMGILWITISGANYPSRLLSSGLFWIEDRLAGLFAFLNAPPILTEVLIYGVYRVLAWVVSVMLPPMAIFFPLFTLLEDSGYLPRVAFNLDKVYHNCRACGKQALTMCMGFGCNATGVIGCRIIDSPRERLIAIITNNFVPCNGRFPTIIALIAMFFVGTGTGLMGSALSAVFLTFVIVLGILTTFLISKLLSATILKGQPSSFTLELPPYRRPQIAQIIVRSLLDRTLLVLGRAVCAAAPAGLVIWLLANITLGDLTLLAHCAAFLDPFARLIGMDGVILFAFILGLPANEIVIPIIIMSYMAKGSLLKIDNLFEIKQLLVNNGWTWITAVSVILFSLMHWPCATTCLTIRRETGGLKWTLVSFIVPTVTGMLTCFAFAQCARLVMALLL